MTALVAAEIVALWEAYRRASATTRAVGIVATASSRSADEIAALPIGRRDAELVQVRCATWGTHAASHAACPSCATDLELELDLAAMLPVSDDVPVETHSLEHDGVELRLRVPTSFDLWAVERSHDQSEAEQTLLERCVLSASRKGDAVAAARLPIEVREAVAAELARIDPLADIRLALACAACGHEWVASFDVGDYVWRELELEARRLLAIVDALARAYGWSEAEILALGPERRRFYLERVGVL